MEEIVNKVAQSGLVTFDPESFYDTTEILSIDLKDNLFQGLILREKDFREFIKEHNWESFSGKNVAVFCSADAIVPTWAYMLVANKLEPFANEVYFGTPDQLQQHLMLRKVESLNIEEFRDKRIVIKGCSKFPVPAGVYVALTNLFSSVAKSIMYGEPCSTVPIFKRK
ncbi:MAG: DUF2480 family protein [Bacteroidetes bacterium]|nr:DUF2480 family protein [Bacteroidota bacterium]